MIDTSTKVLTVEQAIAEGYTLWAYEDSGWVSAKKLDDIIPSCFEKGKIILMGQEVSHPSGLDKHSIADTLADIIASNHGDETGDDTDNVYDAIKSIDFGEAERLITEKLKTIRFYWQTDIELIP